MSDHHFSIKSNTELRNTLGRKTYSVGRETRKKMISRLFERGKIPRGLESGKRHIEIDKPGTTPSILHFEMHDKGVGGLGSLDIQRLSKEFFGDQHASKLKMTKGEMAKSLSKKIHGLTPDSAKRLVETLINEIHGAEHPGRSPVKKKERKTPSFRRPEREQSRYGAHGEDSKNLHEYGSRGEVIDSREEERPASDPRFARTDSDSPDKPGEKSGPSPRTFRDLHLH